MDIGRSFSAEMSFYADGVSAAEEASGRRSSGVSGRENSSLTVGAACEAVNGNTSPRVPVTSFSQNYQDYCGIPGYQNNYNNIHNGTGQNYGYLQQDHGMSPGRTGSGGSTGQSPLDAEFLEMGGTCLPGQHPGIPGNASRMSSAPSLPPMYPWMAIVGKRPKPVHVASLATRCKLAGLYCLWLS